MNKRERQEYILDVRDWIAAGASKTNVIRKFRQQNMPERVAANIYDQAVALIQKEYAQDNQKIKDLISYRYDDLYEKAYDQKKYGVCAQILKEQSELQD
jgi:phosphoenolpyruvate synthase/pyruvate phosphate dikinase